jgi:hypothetical protein
MRVRWYSTLQPTMPPPITTTRACVFIAASPVPSSA